LGLLDTIKTAGAHIKALEDQWLDTTTPPGELILTIMGGIAEFEAFLLPFGAPGEIPPCIRQRPFGIAADRQPLQLLVRAPHRGECTGL
jgi:hypothetical protein